MAQHITRRSVLGAGVAAAASPLFLPRAVLGGVGRIAPSETIAVGFLGMGIRARELLGGFLPHPDLRVVAVCDVDTRRREDAKGRIDRHYGNSDCAMYTDYHDVLARRDIDAVAICTPDHWHTIMVVDACKAGKDIYCEKPLTLSLLESKAMIDAVRATGRIFQTGSQQRTEYDHRFVTACEYVRNGRIGRLLNVNVGVGDPAGWCDLPAEAVEPGLEWDRWLGPAPLRPYNSVLSPRGINNFYPAWRGYREYSGGYFTDMGAHHYDIAQWGMGMDHSGPAEVRLGRDGSRTRGAKLIFDNGVVITHGGPSGTTFIGTDGLIHVDRGRLVSVPDGVLTTPLGDGDLRLPRHKNHLSNWVDCLRSRELPICDVEIGARTIALCHLCNLAYWHGRGFGWDARAWRLTDADPMLMDYERREGYELPSL
ncbi:MAG: Gfo/Idh/MocA family oxidoreductase [Phycisphaeraceae bacterium]|nr:Gfo/Idh/MocA family oxidoreductase [Phycisphaeraceae bacterium]